MIDVIAVPSVEKARRQAFAVAYNAAPDAKEIVLYPVTDNIVAVFDEKIKKPDLTFARVLRKLYEKGERKFLAIWLEDPSDDGDERTFAFYRDGDEFNVYKFDTESVVGGLFTLFTTIRENVPVFVVRSDSGKIEKYVEEALDLANEERRKQKKKPIPKTNVKWGNGNVESEDFALLVKRNDFLTKLKRAVERLSKKREKREIRSETGAAKEVSVTTILLGTVLVVLSLYYWYDNFAHKKERKNDTASMRKKTEAIYAKTAEKNADAAFRAADAIKNGSPFQMAYVPSESSLWIYSDTETVSKLSPKKGFDRLIDGESSISVIPIRGVMVKTNDKRLRRVSDILEATAVSPSSFAETTETGYARLETDGETCKRILTEVAKTNGRYEIGFFLEYDGESCILTMVDSKTSAKAAARISGMGKKETIPSGGEIDKGSFAKK